MTLDDRLLDAHARSDRRTLVRLYTEAADHALHTDAACFYLTHAYVFALELDDPAADALYRRLKAEARV